MSLNPKRSAAYNLGVLAEKQAVSYLRKQGYEILAERYKAPVGEIDILALQDDMLVAVEVKARKTLEEALESITPRNRQRVENALLHFLNLHEGYAAHGMRFDVITLCGEGVMQHLDNAWEARS